MDWEDRLPDDEENPQFYCDEFGNRLLTEFDDDDEEELTPEQVEAYLAKQQEKIFDPKPYDLKVTKKQLAMVDSETDPFEYGLIVEPFAIGLAYQSLHVLNEILYEEFWGDDCVEQYFERLAELVEEGYDFLIYAHNGGKFDFYFFLKYIDPDQNPLIMGGRLVKIKFQGQEHRDSYSIIPQALSKYKKDEIDYNLFTRKLREANRQKICTYLKGDCHYALELVMGFHDMFGDKVTIASASLPMLHSFTGFQRISGDGHDERFRKYYYGGRNQCFETSILKDTNGWKVYDRNSMYPAVMRDVLHPISSTADLQSEIDDDTDFACIDAWNDNCLPVRADDGGLDFTVTRGTFYATGHEIRAGLDTGTLTVHKVRHAWKFHRKASFAEFVDRFYNLRLEAKAVDDKVRDILYKFCLNSGYGKFALNPRKFKQWTFTIGDDAPEPLVSASNPDGWCLHSQSGDLYIWSRPAPRRNGYYNVATAASITGAARANLHRNLALATRPIYCDTDSIICTDFKGELDERTLGGWKLEATGDVAAIGGKKLYAVFNGDEVIKKASKGVRLEAEEIMRVCQGETIAYANPVPNFKLDGSADFVTRNIRKTGG